MADNYTTTGTTDTFAGDEVGAIKVPRVKIQFGEDGTATDASTTNPLPVTASADNPVIAEMATMPAADALTDTLGVALVTGLIVNRAAAGSLTALTPKFAVIDAAVNGDNTIVAAVAAKKLRVLQVFLIAAGTVTTRFESGASGTALTGQMNLVANVGYVLPFSPTGWFETASGALLNLELSGAVSVDGALVYVEV